MGAIKNLIAAIIGLVFTLPCAYQMIFNSGLKWTFTQRQYHGAIVELVLLFCIVCAVTYMLRKSKKRQIIALLAVTLTFCFLHAYFVAIIVGALYAFEIYLLGRTINRFTMAAELKEDFWMCVVSGLSGQIILVGLASLLRVGTADKLRWIVAGLFIILLYINRAAISNWVKALANEETKDKPFFGNKLQVCLFAAICVLFLLQVGRANISLDFDSVWYGLRSEYMLAPETGIYDKVISSVVVYVYSKGIEILSLPFAGLSSTGIVYVTNLFLGLGIIKCSYDICRIKLSKTLSLLAATAVAVTPGIMNMTVTAKSDIPSTFLQLVMIYFAVRAIREKNGSWYGAAIAAGVLSFAFKSSALVFSGAIMVVCILFWILQEKKLRKNHLKPLMVCGAALAFVWGRTMYLTGLPSNFLFPVLYEALGIPTNYPYTFSGTGGVESPVRLLSDWDFLGERLSRLGDILFAPITSETDHIIIAWGGLLFVTVCLISICVVLLRFRKTLHRIMHDRAYAFVLVLFILIGGISVGCMLILPKPDGNYFQIWYALTFIFAAYEFERFDSKDLNKTMASAMLPFILFQLLVCMASSWSWSLGLTPIDLTRLGYYDNREEIQAYMHTVDMDEIYTALEEEPGQRVMVFTSTVNKLLVPAAADAWFDVFRWGNHVTQSPEKFLEYISAAGMDKLILNIDYLLSADNSMELVKYLAEQGYLEVELIEGENALVAVRDVPGEPDQVLMNYLGAAATIKSGRDADGWARKHTVIQIRNGNPVEMKLAIYYPREITGNEVITATLDGKPAGEFVLTASSMVITIPIETVGTHELVLDNPFAFAATPPDVREDLAYIITGITVHELS